MGWAIEKDYNFYKNVLLAAPMRIHLTRKRRNCNIMQLLVMNPKIWNVGKCQNVCRTRGPEECPSSSRRHQMSTNYLIRSAHAYLCVNSGARGNAVGRGATTCCP